MLGHFRPLNPRPKVALQTLWVEANGNPDMAGRLQSTGGESPGTGRWSGWQAHGWQSNLFLHLSEWAVRAGPSMPIGSDRSCVRATAGGRVTAPGYYRRGAWPPSP